MIKNYKFIFKIVVICVLTTSLNAQIKTANSKITEPTGVDNVAYKWGKMAITATANDTDRFRPRPTVTSRLLGLTFVAIFDAWSRYDEKPYRYI